MSRISLSYYSICELVSHKNLDGTKDYLHLVKLCDYSYKKCALKRLQRLKSRSTGLFKILYCPYPFCDESLIQVIYSDF